MRRARTLRKRTEATSIGETLFVGIDEAGYGPNLGPLVVGCVAFRGPASLRESDWWRALAPTVGRAGKGPIAVDDSKRILAKARGFERLAETVHAFLRVTDCPDDSLDSLVDRLASADADDLRREHWFAAGESDVGAAPDPSAREALGAALRGALLQPMAPRARVIFPARFNALLGSHANKADLEAELIRGLLTDCLARETGWRRADIRVDRLGGRRYYRALVEAVAGESFPATIEESPRQSIYRFVSDGREVDIAFRVQADRTCFPVALASMVAKYLRERTMAGLNRFWAARVPDLRPTAGYPQDARRFFSAIEASLDRLGILEESLWRSR